MEKPSTSGKSMLSFFSSSFSSIRDEFTAIISILTINILKKINQLVFDRKSHYICTMNINVIASKEDFDDIMSFKSIMKNYVRFVIHTDVIIKGEINLIVGCKLFNKYNVDIDYHENGVISIPNRREEISKFVKGLNLVKSEFNNLLIKQVSYINLDVNIHKKEEINDKISLCTDKSFIKYENNGIVYYYGCNIIFGLTEENFENTKKDYETLKEYLDKKTVVMIDEKYDHRINEFLYGLTNGKKFIPYIYTLLNE